MRRFTTRDLTLAALVAALYAVMGYFGDVFGLTFGPVQVRFAEALTVLPFLFPAAGPGLAVGCFLTNMLSPYPLDMVLGTLATAVGAWFTARAPKWWLAPLPPILANLAVLPFMWAWQETGAVNAAFWTSAGINAALFLPGETAACYVLGSMLLLALPRVPVLNREIARTRQ